MAESEGREFWRGGRHGINGQAYDGSCQRHRAADNPGAGARDDRQGQYTGGRRTRRSGSGKKWQGRRRRTRFARGMLEFRADPESPYHDKNFAKDKTVILYCASGGRSALSGKVLKDMGYDQVYNLGAFKDWAEGGGAVDKPIELSM